MDSRAETLADEKLGEEKETGRTRTPSPSPIPSIEKEKNEFGDQPTDIEGSIHEAKKEEGDASAEDEVEYPSGLRLSAIVVALLLSIFLVRTWRSGFAGAHCQYYLDALTPPPLILICLVHTPQNITD